MKVQVKDPHQLIQSVCVSLSLFNEQVVLEIIINAVERRTSFQYVGSHPDVEQTNIAFFAYKSEDGVEKEASVTIVAETIEDIALLDVMFSKVDYVEKDQFVCYLLNKRNIPSTSIVTWKHQQ